MECQDVKDRLERFIDNELGDREKTEIAEHMTICTNCAREFEILKSIHAVGKMNYIPEPPPEYWNELPKNIRNRISDLPVKPPKSYVIFENLKNILWPGKISYRLVSITATAVVLFFVIRVSFFTDGKFEAPIESIQRDMIQTTEAEGTPQPHEEMDQKKEAVIQPSYTTSISKTSKDKEGPTSPNQRRVQHEPPPVRSKAVAGVATATDRVSKSAQDKIAFRDKQFISQPAESSRIVTAMKSVRETGILEISEEQPPTMPTVQTDVVFAEMEKKEETETYDMFSVRAKNTKEIPDKIDVWNTYLATNPDQQLLRKVKYEMAQLYYQLAKIKLTEVQIKQSILFFEDNIELLITGDNKNQIEDQLQELKNLLKK